MTQFDPPSGLVFAERSAPVRSMVPVWTTTSRGKRADPSRSLQPRCNSLQEMALQACVWNVDNMEPEALRWLGWPYASRIHDRLKATDTLTFQTWSLFRKAYPEDIGHVGFRVQEPDSESRQYPSVVDRLSRLDVGMLTFLHIQTSDLSIDHLIALTKIDTLAVLALERIDYRYESPPVNSLVETIRVWGRSINESGSLKQLKVFLLRGYGIFNWPNPILQNTILRSMSSCPALRLVGTTGFPNDAPPEDWRNFSTISSLRPDEKTPETLWANTSTTADVKMRQLRDLALGLHPREPTNGDTYPSIAMSYSEYEHGFRLGGRENHPEWFFREFEDEHESTTKRPQGVSLQDARKDHDKRRKIRDNRKVGVDSLLGSFM